MHFARDLVQAVKELMERHWNATEIAVRLGVDPTDVQTIIDIINAVT
jgi:hypothetical protein